MRANKERTGEAEGEVRRRGAEEGEESKEEEE